ncbi:alpha/beta fold hydrolase (plasmid) [Enterobacter ludwigii]|jgi:pimeloyl-ACP methyl ester carboxylesterase
MYTIMRHVLIAVAIAVGTALPAAAQTMSMPATTSSSPVCSDVQIPVALVEGTLKAYTVYGRLCHPSAGPSKTIQILVHGVTYDHNYWSLPGFGGIYDYSGAQNAAGYTTLALDRIGSAGQSSRPASGLVTLLSGAVSLHNVVQAARGGEIPGGPYNKVLMVGHSYGSAIAWLEDVQYNDVDAIISTGLGHLLGNLVGIATSVQPALLDPRLAPMVGLDAGYLTTVPGTRGSLFYNQANTDPAVIAYDEANKGLFTATELGTLALYEVASLGVSGPMFMVIGQKDGLFCLQGGKGGGADCSNAQTLHASEASFFPNADIDTYVLQNAGHDINYELNAADWYAAAAAWATTHVPPQ